MRPLKEVCPTLGFEKKGTRESAPWKFSLLTLLGFLTWLLPSLALAQYCSVFRTLKPSLPLPAETAKLRGFPLFMVTQGFCQFMVCSGPEFIGHVAECAEIVAPEKCLLFETFKGFQNDGEPPV